jgi:hypothetical protein
MVHIKITKSPGSDNVSNELIKLDENQATKVPFPHGCPVMVIEDGSIRYSGEVSAVYISFSESTGSCKNFYHITQSNNTVTLVSGSKLRYALGCPIHISASADTFDSSNTIEGTVKGFEITSDEYLTQNSDQSYVYTVEVSAVGSNNHERVFRQRGIIPEHIRYRHTSNDRHQTSIDNENDTTSVVSLDGVIPSTTKRAKVSSVHDSLIPSTVPECYTTDNSFMNSASLLLKATEMSDNRYSSHSDDERKLYRRCTPMETPLPPCYEGDFEAAKMIPTPEFGTLTNFQPHKHNGEEAVCVMCGCLRPCQGGKSLKTKQMKVFQDKTQDSAVIPNQNKGVCTNCDVNIWVVNATGLQIKWCKGCKNFQSWASFGQKGYASKCIGCRDRQKEKYAASKANTATKRKQSDLVSY